MLDRIKTTLVNDLGFEAQVGDTGIVDENGNFAEPSPYRKLISILLMNSFRCELFCADSTSKCKFTTFFCKSTH